MTGAVNKGAGLKLIVLLMFTAFLSAAFLRDKERVVKADVKPPAQPSSQSTPTPAAAPAQPVPASTLARDEPKTEGCLKCHNNIEPMHRSNATADVCDKLVDGHDDQRLSCTA